MKPQTNRRRRPTTTRRPVASSHLLSCSLSDGASCCGRCRVLELSGDLGGTPKHMAASCDVPRGHDVVRRRSEPNDVTRLDVEDTRRVRVADGNYAAREYRAFGRQAPETRYSRGAADERRPFPFAVGMWSSSAPSKSRPILSTDVSLKSRRLLDRPCLCDSTLRQEGHRHEESAARGRHPHPPPPFVAFAIILLSSARMAERLGRGGRSVLCRARVRTKEFWFMRPSLELNSRERLEVFQVVFAQTMVEHALSTSMWPRAARRKHNSRTVPSPLSWSRALRGQWCRSRGRSQSLIKSRSRPPRPPAPFVPQIAIVVA